MAQKMKLTERLASREEVRPCELDLALETRARMHRAGGKNSFEKQTLSLPYNSSRNGLNPTRFALEQRYSPLFASLPDSGANVSGNLLPCWNRFTLSTELLTCAP